jgi:hypothetical protein
MTTITFKRSGGVSGDDLDLKLDTDTLPEDESQRMSQLISSANFFNIPETQDAQSTPDEFQYTITVEAGQSSHTVHCTNTTMPESLRPLVRELTMLNAFH